MTEWVKAEIANQEKSIKTLPLFSIISFYLIQFSDSQQPTQLIQKWILLPAKQLPSEAWYVSICYVNRPT